jgi:hypothetical protein
VAREEHALDEDIFYGRKAFVPIAADAGELLPDSSGAPGAPGAESEYEVPVGGSCRI